jgi:hypothetical protein
MTSTNCPGTKCTADKVVPGKYQYTRCSEQDNMLTNRDMCVRCHRKFSDNPLWGNIRLPKVSHHLSGSCFVRSIRGGDLYGMIFGVIPSNGSDVCGDLTIFQLRYATRKLLLRAKQHLKTIVTCRTVTGSRAP